jgi:hypothetical protein
MRSRRGIHTAMLINGTKSTRPAKSLPVRCWTAGQLDALRGEERGVAAQGARREATSARRISPCCGLCILGGFRCSRSFSGGPVLILHTPEGGAPTCWEATKPSLLSSWRGCRHLAAAAPRHCVISGSRLCHGIAVIRPLPMAHHAGVAVPTPQWLQRTRKPPEGDTLHPLPSHALRYSLRCDPSRGRLPRARGVDADAAVSRQLPYPWLRTGDAAQPRRGAGVP